MKKFQVPATLTRIAFLRDGGVSLGFSTQELNSEEKVALSDYHNTFGFLLFKPNEFLEEEIPKEDAEFEGKTPSQRLRNVLFVYWRDRGSVGDFEAFYRVKMESLISIVKERLEGEIKL